MRISDWSSDVCASDLKLLVIDASLQAEQYALAAIALLVGLLTLYSMMKIWLEAFWRPEPAPSGRVPEPALPRGRLAIMMVPIAILAGVTMTIGIWTEPFVAMAAPAADELPDRRAYIAALLGDGASGAATPR